MFKNVCLYTAPNTIGLDADKLRESLRLLPPNVGETLAATQHATDGWRPVLASENLVHQQEEHLFLRYATDKRLLPAKIIKQEVEARARQYTDAHGFTPSRKMIREIKESVITELLPKALIERKETLLWIDTKRGRIAVDAASAAKAEAALQRLRKDLGSLEAVPIARTWGPEAHMSLWLLHGVPNPFQIENECELVDVTNASSKVKYQKHELVEEDMRRLLGSGHRVSQIALNWNDRIWCVLNDKSLIKKVAFMDFEPESEADDDGDGVSAALALISGHYTQMIEDFERVLPATN